MYDAPSRSSLVETALDAFRAEILPHLDGEKKYVGLMVASALAIALREFAADTDGAAARRLLDAFAKLYGEDNVARAGYEGTEAIAMLNRHLARELRDGQYDEALFGPVFDLLTIQAEEKLKLSNPKFIAAAEFSQPTPS